MIVAKHTAAAKLTRDEGTSLSLPPPLWGKVGEGGSPKRGWNLWLPLSLPLPHKGGGNERAVAPSHHQKFSNDFSCASTVHGVVFDLLSERRPA